MKKRWQSVAVGVLALGLSGGASAQKSAPPDEASALTKLLERLPEDWAPTVRRFPVRVLLYVGAFGVLPREGSKRMKTAPRNFVPR